MVIIYDLSSGTELHTFERSNVIYTAAFSPDGTALIAAGSDNIQVKALRTLLPPKMLFMMLDFFRIIMVLLMEGTEFTCVAVMGKLYSMIFRYAMVEN